MDWQPIETAPRDGTEVLVGSPVVGVTIAKYDATWAHPYWNFDTQELCPWPCEVPKVTDWMPLPEPPQACEAGGYPIRSGE